MKKNVESSFIIEKEENEMKMREGGERERGPVMISPLNKSGVEDGGTNFNLA